MSAEVEALLARLDRTARNKEHPMLPDGIIVYKQLAADASAVIRAQAEEIAQVTSERDLLGTVIGTGYPPPASLIRDEMTRRRAARAVELHEEIVFLREQLFRAPVLENDAVSVHVATKLISDPYDDRDGFWLSIEDLDNLRKLPAGTKIYVLKQARMEQT
jgi:hypothetical protein